VIPATIALLVSGGHTSILKVDEVTKDINVMGATMDDAAGEAFDKIARLLGLPFPGGPELDRLATTGNSTAINFPILVHELIKGTYEVIADLHSQPKDADGNIDKDLARRVKDKEDSKNKEIWDFRLGPAIWDILKDSFPEETITDEDKAGIQLIMFQTIVSKPAKQFLVFMREVLSNTDTSKRLMKSLYDMINGEINDYDYKVAMEEFDKQLDDITKGIDDDDLYGELGGLGIDKPRD
jgi:hypothetical protein